MPWATPALCEQGRGQDWAHVALNSFQFLIRLKYKQNF
jgi:hypothetical protein